MLNLSWSGGVHPRAGGGASFAFNILKAKQTDTLSQDRYRAGLSGIKKLLRMLAVP